MNPDELEAYAKARSMVLCRDDDNRCAFMLGVYQWRYAELWHECQRLRREAEEAWPKVLIAGETL